MRTIILAISAGLLLVTACERRESPPVVGVENDTLPEGGKSPLGAKIEGDVWRVDEVGDEIVLVPFESEVHLQAGRELRFTAQQFQALLGGDQRADDARARPGMKVRVIRDADGKLSKLVLEP